MKKIVSYLLIVMIAVTLVVATGSAALAADSISTSVKISPASLTGAGTVKVTVTITNNGDPIKNVVLKYPAPTDTEEALGDMETGASKEHTADWAISEEMLGQQLKFMVYWTSSNGSQNSGSTQPFVIEKQESTLNISGSTEASAREVNKGDVVRFTFTMKNSGNVKVDNAYLNAPPIDSGNKIGKDFSLDPNSTKKMEYDVTVNSDMDVKPVFTYTAGGQQYTLQLDTISVRVNAASQASSISAALDVDKTTVEAGGNVKFNIRINNTGQVGVSGLAVTDFDGNAVTISPTSLQPGERATGSVEIPIARSGNYSFKVTGKDENGNSVSTETNAVAISTGEAVPSEEPTASAALENAVMVRVSLATSMPAPGELNVKFEVVNLIDQNMKDIVVSAVQGDTTKTMATLDALAAQQTQELSGVLDVVDTSDYIFKVTAFLEDGTLVESETTPVTITVTGEAEEGMSSTMLGVIVVLVAIAVVAICLGVYISRQKKKNKAKAEARPKQPQRGQQVSPNGRQRPPRYSNAQMEQDGRPDSRQPAQRQQRIETIEPRPRPEERPAPKPNGESGTKYGDRNKF